MPAALSAFRLFRRREVPVPTVFGFLALLAILAGGGWLFLSRVHPFLAVNAPVGGEILVVEGWIPDYALKEALAVFRRHRYAHLIATGSPLPQGLAISSLGSYAQVAARTLEAFGLPADSISVVPSPWVPRDRTYAEGESVAAWMRARGRAYGAIDLFSFSAHARRSRMLYRMALGGGVEVGVYAPRDRGYDPLRWWVSSAGVRRVGDECIAYLYARFLFRK